MRYKNNTDGERVPFTAEEEAIADASESVFKAQQSAQVEADRVASIWEQIKEQEQLAIRAMLENDTVWIETRKNNILALKGEL